MKNFDAIVIGTGQAGPSVAQRLTASGMTVAIIERKLFGGTCVNTGCTPTKTMVASAYAANMARRAAEYGVSVGGSVSVESSPAGTTFSVRLRPQLRGVHDLEVGPLDPAE